MHLSEKRCESQGYWNKSSLTGVDPTVLVSVKRVAFTTRRVVKTNHLTQQICEVPRARCNKHDRHYCYCWLVSCETASLWGKLRSSWILCISSSASWDADMSPRSPINSSVSCRRAFLWREWHKLQFKWLVTILWFVKCTKGGIKVFISFLPFRKSEFILFPPLSLSAVSRRLSCHRLHAYDQSASGKPEHKFIYTFKVVYIKTYAKESLPAHVILF